MSREATIKVLGMMDEGSLDAATLVQDLLGYLSEDEVRDFCNANDIDLGLDDDEDDEPDESMDGDFDSAMASAGWGTDEDYGYCGE